MTKWKHASLHGMHLTGAMASDNGRIWCPPHYRARTRAFTAEDLAAARDLRLKGHKEAARKMLTQDAAMFREFTEANPYFPGAVREFQALLDKAAGGGLDELARDAAGFYGG